MLWWHINIHAYCSLDFEYYLYYHFMRNMHNKPLTSYFVDSTFFGVLVLGGKFTTFPSFSSLVAHKICTWYFLWCNYNLQPILFLSKEDCIKYQSFIYPSPLFLCIHFSKYGHNIEWQNTLLCRKNNFLKIPLFFFQSVGESMASLSSIFKERQHLQVAVRVKLVRYIFWFF